MKSLLFIFNAKAGKGLVRTRLADILSAFAAEGWLVTTCPTMHRGDATRLSRELGPGYDRLVCAGGDGTLHEVMEGLMGVPADRRPPIGYIPAGTTNDFARNLSLPRGMEKMAHVAASGVPRYVDLGRLDDSCFLYVAAFGAFTDVAYNTPQEAKNALGHLAYLLKGVTELANLKSSRLKVEYDGGTLEGDFIYGMFTNTISVGGVLGLPAQEVALDDGVLDAILVRTPQNPAELNAAVMSLASQNFHDPASGVVGLHSSRFEITAPQPISFTLDGEYGGEHDRCRIEAIYRPVQIVYGK